MIHIFLVRHGAAEDAAPGMSDALRALSAKGRKRFHKTARSFAGKARSLDLILTSPLVRAVQTAEILASEVKQGALAALEELAPGHLAAEALKAVSKRARQIESVALVGHEPQLSQLAAALLRVPTAKAASIDIRPGAVVRIDVSGLPQAKKAQARWWIKSRGRHEGLPWKEEKPSKAKAKAGPAKAQAKASAKKEAGPAPAAQKRKPSAPAKKKAAPKPRAQRKPAPEPRSVAAAPKPAAPRPAAAPIAAAPRPAAPAPAKPPQPKTAAAPAAQKFMGAPRPPGPPPPRPAASPPPAPAAPQAAPPSSDKPPDASS